MHGKTMREALQEARDYRDDTNEGGPGSGPQKGGKKQSSADIKKAYGILNDPRYKQGNYSGAAKAIDKLSPGLSNHPDVKNAMKRANEELEEANRYSVALKGDAKKLFDLSWKAGSKSKAYGDKEWDAAVDDTAKKYRNDNHIRISDKDIAAVKKAVQYNEFDPSTNEELDETMVVTKVDKDTNSPAYQKFKAGDKRYVYKENLDLSATGDTTTSNASQEDETVELDEAAFSQTQIDALKQKYSGLRGSEKNGIQMDKLAKIMKRYPKDHLNQLAKLDIPMVSKVAKAMTEETFNENWQYEMEIEYGDSMDDDQETIVVFGNVRGATLESQADRKYEQLEKQMQKKYGRDAMIDGGTMKGKTNDRSRGGSNPIERKDI